MRRTTCYSYESMLWRIFRRHSLSFNATTGLASRPQPPAPNCKSKDRPSPLASLPGTTGRAGLQRHRLKLCCRRRLLKLYRTQRPVETSTEVRSSCRACELQLSNLSRIDSTLNFSRRCVHAVHASFETSTMKIFATLCHYVLMNAQMISSTYCG